MTNQPQDATTQPTIPEPTTQQPDRRAMLAGMGLLGLAGIATLAKTAQAGPLNPPTGPIAPTGRTMQEIYDRVARTAQGLAEPRIPVQSLAPSGTALYAITQPGAYYLTGNIVCGAGQSGILIQSNDVYLDLSEFSIRGQPGSVNGIDIATGISRVQICNGAIATFGMHGIRAEFASKVTLCDLLLQDNAQYGSLTGELCVIRRCTAVGNLLRGFSIDKGTTVENSTTQNSGYPNPNAETAAGIYVKPSDPTYMSSSCIVRDHSSIFDVCGINVRNQCIIEECLITGASKGIIADNGCSIRSNTVQASSYGIRVNSQCTIEDNHIITNEYSSAVVLYGGQNIVRKNTLFGVMNSSSDQPGRNFIVQNITKGSFWFSNRSDIYGPIVSTTQISSGVVLTNLFESEHAQANFCF